MNPEEYGELVGGHSQESDSESPETVENLESSEPSSDLADTRLNLEKRREQLTRELLQIDSQLQSVKQTERQKSLEIGNAKEIASINMYIQELDKLMNDPEIAEFEGQYQARLDEYNEKRTKIEKDIKKLQDMKTALSVPITPMEEGKKNGLWHRLIYAPFADAYNSGVVGNLEHNRRTQLDQVTRELDALLMVEVTFLEPEPEHTSRVFYEEQKLRLEERLRWLMGVEKDTTIGQ